ncbi:glycosyltransferase family 1 protein, partial [Streptomyces sp. NPDC059781]
ERVLRHFTWARAAQGTVARYREAMAGAGRDTAAARSGARAADRAATGAVDHPAPATPDAPVAGDAGPDTPTDTAAAVHAADTSDRESRATC